MPKIIENLQERLLAETLRQLEQVGYGGLKVRSVASACGVSVGTVYNYFPSKDGLLASAMLIEWNRCLAVIREAGAGSGDPETLLRTAYEQLNLFADAHRNVFQDEEAIHVFHSVFHQYHGMLRSQLAVPILPFCKSNFAAEFTAEALLTWSLSGTSFGELWEVLSRVLQVP